MGTNVQVVDVVRDKVELWESFIDSIDPTSYRVIVTKPIVQEISESRTIIIPETAKRIDKEFGLECKVLKIGALVAAEVEVGDIVIIPEFAGIPIVLGIEVPFWMVGEGDIMAIIKGE